jgi:hypothetical protein
MTTRINARIDAQLSARVARVRKQTGKSTTQIIEEALDSYLSRLTDMENSAELFQRAGFIASGDGPQDLAVNAKSYWADALRAKK